MSTPAAQITTSGTPITSQPGTGAVAGNAITISGLTLAPSGPGWVLVSSQGGPGQVSGTWQYGSIAQPGMYPAQGAFYRSGRGGTGGGGGDNDTDIYAMPDLQPSGFQLTNAGWLLIGLIATLLLTGKGK